MGTPDLKIDAIIYYSLRLINTLLNLNSYFTCTEDSSFMLHILT